MAMRAESYRAIHIALAISAFLLLCKGITPVQPANASDQPGAAQGNEESQLVTGYPARASISGGASNRYRFPAQAGYLVALRIGKKDFNLRVAVSSPSGRTLFEVVSRHFGPFQFSFITDASGDYLIEILSLEKSSNPIEYSLEVIETRIASPLDQELNEASVEFARGDTLAAIWKKEEMDEGVRAYLASAVKQRESGRHSEAALSFERAGETFFILSDYKAATRAYGDAEMESIRAGDIALRAAALNGVGYVFVYQGEVKKAKPYFEQALALAGTLGASSPLEAKRLKAAVLNNLGEVYYFLSDPHETLKDFNAAVSLWQEIGDRQGQALTELNLGYLQSDLGNLKEALSHLSQALWLFHDVGSAWGEAYAAVARGLVRSFLGRTQEALESYEKGMEVFRSIGDRRGEAVAHTSLGDVYLALDDIDAARKHYGLGLERYREVGSMDSEAVSLLSLGWTYRKRDDKLTALNYYKQSLDLSRRVGNRRVETYALKELAALYEDLKDGINAGRRSRDALRTYRRILADYARIKDKRGQAYSLLEIGRIEQRLNRIEDALNTYRAALVLAESAEDVAGRTSIMFAIAAALQNADRPDEALASIERSIALIESLRTEVINKDLRASYFASVYQHYSLYVDLLMQMNESHPSAESIRAAIEASEKARARALLDVLKKSELVESEEAISERGQISGIGDRKEVVRKPIDSNAVNGSLVNAPSLEIEPADTAVAAAQPLKLNEIQAELKDDATVLLQFFFGDERSYAWAVTRSDARGYVLPKRKRIEQEANLYCSLIKARERIDGETEAQYQNRVSEADCRLPYQAALLSQMILGPLRGYLDRRRLLIAPDGVLYFVPFETLPDPDDVKNNADWSALKPLVFDHELIIQPSISILAAIRRESAQRAIPSKTAFVLADPVFDRNDRRVSVRPGSSQDESNLADAQSTSERAATNEQTFQRLRWSALEARYVSETAGYGRSRVLSGFDATLKSATDKEVANYRIVHFATHAQVDTVNPALSRIVLSRVDQGGKEQNGSLGLYDIYGLHLNADLAVLSACRTALGKEVKGEGLIGLSRGFMHAGARSVIASLWEVDDEATAEFMKHFYTSLLLDEESAAVALNRAKRKMMDQQKWKPAYYWSGFILQGEYDCTIASAKSGSLLSTRSLAIAAASIILLCGTTLLMRKMGRRKKAAAHTHS